MSHLYQQLICVALLLLSVSARAQGFQNLNFENATIVTVPGDPYGRVQFIPAFPGWTGYVGTNSETLALFNNLFLSTADVGLLGPGWTGGGRIQGNYTAVLQSGNDPILGGTNSVVAALAQTGVVPAGSASIRFVGSQPRNGFTLSLGGTEIPMSAIGTQGAFTVFGGDISQLRDLARSSQSR